MNLRAPTRAALGVALAGALIGGVILVARSRSDPPSRCAAGMIALGARCCGEGQSLADGRCVGAPSRCAASMSATPEGCVATPRKVRIQAGTLRIGPGDWEAQGTIKPFVEALDAFDLDVHEVTESRYAECEAAAACAPIPRTGEPGRAVAGVTLAEASRFCAWAGGSLPTSGQLAFAAAGPSARRYAWGDTGAVCRRGAWGLKDGPCGEGAAGPELAGSHPDGASPEGIHDLAGNVAEWTLPGSASCASADVRDGSADVRGGSWADAAASALRSWNRRALDVNARSSEVGFRCAYRAAL